MRDNVRHPQASAAFIACIAAATMLACGGCGPEAKVTAAPASMRSAPDSRPITLASMPGATPYPDFATDGHVTLDIRHVAAACTEYPTSRCATAGHWRISLNGTHVADSAGGEEALIAALTAAVLPHRPTTRPATPPRTAPVLIVVDRDASFVGVRQALSLCWAVRHNLYLDLGVNTLDISHLVTDPARPTARARIQSLMGIDPSLFPGTCIGMNSDEIPILMWFDDHTRVLQRLYGMRDIPEGAAGDAQIARLLHEGSDSSAAMGKREPIVIDPGDSVLWQEAVDIAAMCTSLNTAGVAIGGLYHP